MTDQVANESVGEDPEADWYAVPDVVSRGWRSPAYLYSQLGNPEGGPNGMTGWPRAAVHTAEIREILSALPLVLTVVADRGDGEAVSVLARLRDDLSSES